MPPRLAAISGKHKGAVFAINEDTLVIGRETSAHVSIADASVSRRHSKIEKKDEGFVITDLESLNGTFVNDVPVRSRLLEHGDRVRIGDSQFLFLTHEGDSMSKSSEVKIEETQVVSGSTVQIRFDHAIYLMGRDLSALMKVSTALTSIRSLDDLLEHLLELLFEVVPAQRGAILLTDEGSFVTSLVFGLHRTHGKNKAVTVSRTIVQQVLRDGVALLANDGVSEWTEASDSLISTGAQSVMCVPLLQFDRKIGVLYLDTTLPRDQFNNDHLKLVAAISGIAAVAIENARQFEWLETENERLLSDVNIEHNMIGEAAAMQHVYYFISKVAPTDATVLISGESGTGKELAARAIHRNSKRAQKAFMAVNCAALNESLLESELFGHERGSFTGALNQKKGRLEIADGGTIFLDEIGELTPALQVKLLRVLQEREFERVGGTVTLKVDLRVIAATNKNLEEAIEAGEFRQDLYYRLNVVSLEMPPLRERREDIMLLANYFADKYGTRCNRKLKGFSPEARTCLMSYDWPGNVRELENAIERAIVLGTTDLIRPEDLPEAVVEARLSSTSPLRYHEAVTQAKKQIILEAAAQVNGNFAEAARLLGVHPNYLQRLVQNLQIKIS
ncbi:MAG TPA: sigma 54-interacting transcriptional regulator [Pyrinomonadaceae bacterium]|jgi:Nif-specific regulatory protein|nr:sigma 54-interacting transcriptional regulator [Pyrinomonadaceae bacterium]